MKKLTLLISTAALLAAGASGCADSCEDLEEICQLCGDADYYQSCTQLVQDGNQPLCDLETPTFTQNCVSTEGPNTSTDTGSSSGTASSSSSGAGGAASSSSGTGGAGTGGAEGT